MTPIQAAFIALFVVGVFLMGCTAKLMHRLARSLRTFELPRSRKAASPSDIPMEPCQIETSDGRVIDGALFPSGSATRRSVVFVPESGGDPASVTPYLDTWIESGLDVLVCSAPTPSSSSEMGQSKDHPWVTRALVNDVLASIDYMCRHRDCEAVLLMGLSRGGLTAICAAAVDGRVAAVIADSCYLCEDLIAHYVRRYARAHSFIGPYLMKVVPTCVLSWHGRLALRRVLAESQEAYPQPHRSLGRLRQPVLLIHGNLDKWVPIESAKRLDQRLPNSQLWMVKGGGHTNSVHVSPSEYKDRIGRLCEMVFPDTTLESKPSGAGA